MTSETGNRMFSSCHPSAVPTCIVDLPHAILDHIARSTRGYSRKSLRSTCKALRAVCQPQECRISIPGPATGRVLDVTSLELLAKLAAEWTGVTQLRLTCLGLDWDFQLASTSIKHQEGATTNFLTDQEYQCALLRSLAPWAKLSKLEQLQLPCLAPLVQLFASHEQITHVRLLAPRCNGGPAHADTPQRQPLQHLQHALQALSHNTRLLYLGLGPSSSPRAQDSILDGVLDEISTVIDLAVDGWPLLDPPCCHALASLSSLQHLQMRLSAPLIFQQHTGNAGSHLFGHFGITAQATETHVQALFSALSCLSGLTALVFELQQSDFLGGDVHRLARTTFSASCLTSLRHLTFSAPLQHISIDLRGATRLTHLSLTDTGRILRHLDAQLLLNLDPTAMPMLRSLRAVQLSVDDEVAVALRHCPQLQHLAVGTFTLSCDTPAGMLPSLHTLRVDNQFRCGTPLRTVAPALHTLHLGHSRRSARLGCLQHSPSLATLQVNYEALMLPSWQPDTLSSLTTLTSLVLHCDDGFLQDSMLYSRQYTMPVLPHVTQLSIVASLLASPFNSQQAPAGCLAWLRALLGAVPALECLQLSSSSSWRNYSGTFPAELVLTARVLAGMERLRLVKLPVWMLLVVPEWRYRLKPLLLGGGTPEDAGPHVVLAQRAGGLADVQSCGDATAGASTSNSTRGGAEGVDTCVMRGVDDTYSLGSLGEEETHAGTVEEDAVGADTRAVRDVDSTARRAALVGGQPAINKTINFSYLPAFLRALNGDHSGSTPGSPASPNTSTRHSTLNISSSMAAGASATISTGTGTSAIHTAPGASVTAHATATPSTPTRAADNSRGGSSSGDRGTGGSCSGRSSSGSGRSSSGSGSSSGGGSGSGSSGSGGSGRDGSSSGGCSSGGSSRGGSSRGGNSSGGSSRLRAVQLLGVSPDDPQAHSPRQWRALVLRQLQQAVQQAAHPQPLGFDVQLLGHTRMDWEAALAHNPPPAW